MKIPIKDSEIMLFKAERDYKSGIILLDSELEDQAIYHFQQAGEKALKSILFFYKAKVPKNHDLSNVLDKIIELDKEFEKLYESAENLTPYSTAYRYMDTGFGLVPSHDLVEEAKNDSLKILEFVKNKLNKNK
ncbi:HEPN domain-containing protein [Fusobacteria bacterium ZRK30]|nr:HEPN domain-containing protein [Fusobacteria bacterium ZRK30]